MKYNIVEIPISILMYYLLNYFPSILYIIFSIVSIKIDFGIFAIAYLFVKPLYLLGVNIHFICKKSISYGVSVIHMFSVIIFNVLYTITVHKIQTGYFIGDVPEGIYYIMFGVPALIITIGMSIMIFIKKRP